MEYGSRGVHRLHAVALLRWRHLIALEITLHYILAPSMMHKSVILQGRSSMSINPFLRPKVPLERLRLLTEEAVGRRKRG